MYYSNYEIENMVKKILEKMGEEYDVKANLKTYRDSYSYIYGDTESYTLVKGQHYHFDKLNIRGYYYNNNYYFSVMYGSWWEDVFGEYCKKENGEIINENEQIWKTYLLEVYNSLDDLVKNKKAKEHFFKNYGAYIPWKRLEYGRTGTTKEYIKELNITLVLKTSCGTDESIETYKHYFIYDGNRLVYDSAANFFLDGQWKDNFINYLLAKKLNKEREKTLQKERTFNNSLDRIRSIRNNGNK